MAIPGGFAAGHPACSNWRGPYHSDDRRQYSSVSDGRLYAAGKRAEISGEVRVLRRIAGTGSGQVLEEIREEGVRQSGRICRQEKGDGGSRSANRFAGGRAGGEAAEDLCADAEDPELELRATEKRGRTEAGNDGA